MTEFFALLAIGFSVGTVGTLVGAGGGFLLVPILLYLKPNESAVSVTSVSLAVVFFNALSGSLAFALQGKIHYRVAFMFIIASLPAAWLGAYATALVSREQFETTFGVVLLALAIYLLIRPKSSAPATPGVPAVSGVRLNLPLILVLGFAVGFISSFFGIGGGILQVPLMIQLLGFPVAIATATSQFNLLFVAAIGTFSHWQSGALEHGFGDIMALAPGAVLGAQMGAKLSRQIGGQWIVRILSILLLIVALRYLLPHRL